jgi:cyclin B
LFVVLIKFFCTLIIREGARMLLRSHATAPDANLKTVYEKYAVERFGRVALHPPAALCDLV